MEPAFIQGAGMHRLVLCTENFKSAPPRSPLPHVIAADIVADLEAALEQFRLIEEDVKQGPYGKWQRAPGTLRSRRV